MYKGILKDHMTEFCKNISEKTNNNMPEQLKHFKKYKSKSDKRKNNNGK